MKPLHPYPIDYTPVKAMGADYLRRKFAKIRREQRAADEAKKDAELRAIANVKQINRRTA